MPVDHTALPWLVIKHGAVPPDKRAVGGGGGGIEGEEASVEVVGPGRFDVDVFVVDELEGTRGATLDLVIA